MVYAVMMLVGQSTVHTCESVGVLLLSWVYWDSTLGRLGRLGCRLAGRCHGLPTPRHAGAGKGRSSKCTHSSFLQGSQRYFTFRMIACRH